MNLPSRARLPHAVPHWVAENSLFLITINCQPRSENQLCRAEVGDTIFQAAEFNNEQNIWRCQLLLLMPDHLHAIITFPREPGLKTVITNWKTFLARRHSINWQRDFFDHRIRTSESLAEKTSYILMNPVRKNLCDRPEDWPWLWRPPEPAGPFKVGLDVPASRKRIVNPSRTGHVERDPAATLLFSHPPS